MTALSWCWMLVILHGDFFLVIKKSPSYRQQSSSLKSTVEALISGNSRSNLFKIGDR